MSRPPGVLDPGPLARRSGPAPSSTADRAAGWPPGPDEADAGVQCPPERGRLVPPGPATTTAAVAPRSRPVPSTPRSRGRPQLLPWRPPRRSGCRPESRAPAGRTGRRKISIAPPEWHGLTTTSAPGVSGNAEPRPGAPAAAAACPSRRAGPARRRARTSPRSARPRSPRCDPSARMTRHRPARRGRVLGAHHGRVHERHRAA